MDFYTPQEFKRFLSAAHRNSQEAKERGFLSEWDYYVFFAIAFYTGLRKGKIHSFQWSNISGSFLFVKRSIAQKTGRANRKPLLTKASVRTLQIPVPFVHYTKRAA